MAMFIHNQIDFKSKAMQRNSFLNNKVSIPEESIIINIYWST
jgi:hypothetical protein